MERVQHDTVGARENLRAEDVQPCAGERAGEFSEQARAVPGADRHARATAVRLVLPLDGGRKRDVRIVAEKAAHEAVREREVGDDFRRGVDEEIARRQGAEVGLRLAQLNLTGEQAHDFGEEKFTLLFLRAKEDGRASQFSKCLVVEGPEQRVLEAVPELVTRAQRVRQRVERELVQVLRRLHERGEVADHGRVVEVAALGNLDDGEVMLDEQSEDVRGRAVQAEAARNALGHARAVQFVVAAVHGLAGVVQEQREVEDEGTLDFLEHLLIRRGVRDAPAPDVIEPLDAHQRVLVGGVEVEELVLNEAGEFAELG